MPLIHSASKDAVSRNIRQLRSENYPQRQAIAIALDVQRRARGKRAGGIVGRFAGGGELVGLAPPEGDDELLPPPANAPLERIGAAGRGVAHDIAVQPFLDMYRSATGQLTDDEVTGLIASYGIGAVGGLPGRAAARAMPWATGAAALAASTSPAQAEPRLSREQQRALIIERERSKLDAARQSELSASQAALERLKTTNQYDLDRKAREDALLLEQRRRESEIASAEEQRAREAALPYRSSDPGMSKGLQYFGTGLAGFLPYSVRRSARNAINEAAMAGWEPAIGRALAAIKGSDPLARKASAAELRALERNYKANPPPIAPSDSWKKTAGFTGGSGLIQSEFSAIPEEIDYFNPNPQTSAEAQRKLLEPMRHALPFLAGATAGISSAKLPVKSQIFPTEERARAAGLLQGLAAADRQATAAKAAATRSKSKAKTEKEPGEARGGVVGPEDFMQGFVGGGLAAPQPYISLARNAGHMARSQGRRGFIATTGAGRADRVPMSARPHSYVLPADVVSGLGQGNSMAGAKLFSQLIGSMPYGAPKGQGPYGSAMLHRPSGGMGVHMPKLSGAPRMRADGGGASDGENVPIITAGGEYVLSPEDVAAFGGGDVRQGHDRLDELVKSVRAQVVKRLHSLPGPTR